MFLFTFPPRRPRKAAPRRTFRPNLQVLEDRLAPALAFALTGATPGAANLLSFDTATPAVTSSVAITGLDVGERLVGLDFRPANGTLYALGVNAGADTATLYTISPANGTAA